MGEYTIAIVDDDPSIQEVLKAFLEREHYRVVVAGSYEEVLAGGSEAKKKRFDAFLMDIHIAGGSGIEFCRDIRSLKEYEHTPIICFTSQDDPQVLLSAFKAGADDFISKPINYISLLARLKLQLKKTEYFTKLERAQQMLRRYLSPRVAKVAEEYSETGNDSPAPVECEVAICFTDIRGFTALSETMDPGELFKAVSGHLGRQVELVYKYGGYIDKFNGDGIMAVFDGEDMVLKSCLCALEILEDTRSNSREGKFPIAIGIHVGRVMMGNIGSPPHFDYSVIGPAVNLAARLCGHAEPEMIVVSTSVRDSVKADSGLMFLDRREVAVRGVSGMVQVFSLGSERGMAKGN